jgi:hypothetical protein
MDPAEARALRRALFMMAALAALEAAVAAGVIEAIAAGGRGPAHAVAAGAIASKDTGAVACHATPSSITK